LETGFYTPKFHPTNSLENGQIGYVTTGLKEVRDCRVGDTITLYSDEKNYPTALPGYKEVKPMVFSGLYPTNTDDFEELRDSLEKLRLNDASLIFQPETSSALGFGFRCGFLGMG
jgi:GTP-binding protein LepA